ncbi:MAG TPA: carboxypeptidase regulatory-like domain-containing protein [Albitalea sp.]|uniref:carboxypeptidase regulatory-like domain-containing protein n=1 Tax=Piscinibacter sp. TaxID=1903157 RepID=UPI002ED43528
MRMHAWAIFPAAAVLASAAALAQTGALPPEQRAGEVGYVTGGVGDDEATAFKQAAPAYPLTIEVVRNQAGRNEYTNGAQVQITRRSGDVLLSARAEGPFMLVRLPPGDYRVEATLNGRTLAKDVSVSGNGSARAVLSFAGD